MKVDYAVVCTGLYSHPFIPAYQGAEAFAGTQLHAKDFVDMSLAKGRRVLIVGAGKTAMDCVCGLVASRTAASVTLLYRQAHWPVPRSVWGLSVRSLLFNRAIGAMLPPYYEAGAARRAAAALTKPIRTLFWRSLQAAIAHKFKMTVGPKPAVDLPNDLFYGGQVLDDTMDGLMADPLLTRQKGELNRIVRNGVILQDNSFLPVDVILYCTGYSKSYDFLEGSMRERLGLQKDGLYLYRNCLPHAVPHLAFVGSEVSTFNSILTTGLQALWLSKVLSGKVELPTPEEMVDDIHAQEHWRRKVMPPQRSRGAVLRLYMQHYHDQLLRDMGASPKRKGLNLLAECFGAYTAADYSGLMQDPAGSSPAGSWGQVPPLEALALDEASIAASVTLSTDTVSTPRSPGARLPGLSGLSSLLRGCTVSPQPRSGTRPASPVPGAPLREPSWTRRSHCSGGALDSLTCLTTSLVGTSPCLTMEEQGQGQGQAQAHGLASGASQRPRLPRATSAREHQLPTQAQKQQHHHHHRHRGSSSTNLQRSATASPLHLHASSPRPSTPPSAFRHPAPGQAQAQPQAQGQAQAQAHGDLRGILTRAQTARAVHAAGSSAPENAVPGSGSAPGYDSPLHSAAHALEGEFDAPRKLSGSTLGRHEAGRSRHGSGSCGEASRCHSGALSSGPGPSGLSAESGTDGRLRGRPPSLRTYAGTTGSREPLAGLQGSRLRADSRLCCRCGEGEGEGDARAPCQSAELALPRSPLAEEAGPTADEASAPGAGGDQQESQRPQPAALGGSATAVGGAADQELLVKLRPVALKPPGPEGKKGQACTWEQAVLGPGGGAHFAAAPGEGEGGGVDAETDAGSTPRLNPGMRALSSPLATAVGPASEGSGPVALRPPRRSFSLSNWANRERVTGGDRGGQAAAAAEGLDGGTPAGAIRAWLGSVG
ncbi:hypothetical protein HYH03_004951 [Edaphochlamys debaryana]|uniref:Flavin-containing monooxygenase n=1 Tax=Edaphochlamys debaryana TaxID=47281 RepID=A0A836C1N5_9CHLO|nr:hypothetical protein HYH03_004951 [Edaphochlamys debaryana]|eukprot:KAG2496945.1 hypothetical protein HYH03_004951 [Edaphochlamys debaryana]